MPKYLAPKISAAILLGVILAIALILRLLSLQGESFWLDEAYSFYQARNPFLFSADNPFHLVKFSSRLAFIRHILADDIHPPFYYGQLALWSQLSVHDLWMRSNSILWGMCTIIATYGLAKQITQYQTRSDNPAPAHPANRINVHWTTHTETIALLSATLVACSPFFVEMSIELRMYGLMTFLAVLSISNLHQVLSGAVHRVTPSGRPWIFYTLANTLFMYSQGIGFLWFIIQVILYGSIVAPDWLRNRTVPTTLKPWIWSQAIALLAFLPWALLVITMSGRIRGANYLRIPNLLDLVSVPGQLLFNNAASFSYPSPVLTTPLPILWGLWGLTLALVAIALYTLRQRWLDVLCLTVPSLGALGLVFVVSVTAKPIFIVRALSFTLPFFAVLVAIGLVSLVQHLHHPPRWRATLLTGLIAGLIGINGCGIYQGIVTANRTQWQAVGDLLNQQVQLNDVVVVPYSSAGEFLLYNSVPRDQYNGELIEQLRLYWREPENFVKIWGPDYLGFLRSHNLDYQKSVRLLLLTSHLEQLERHRPAASRVWLITSPGRTGGELERYQAQLANTKSLKTTDQFFRATVMLYE